MKVKREKIVKEWKLSSRQLSRSDSGFSNKAASQVELSEGNLRTVVEVKAWLGVNRSVSASSNITDENIANVL